MFENVNYYTPLIHYTITSSVMRFKTSFVKKTFFYSKLNRYGDDRNRSRSILYGLSEKFKSNFCIGAIDWTFVYDIYQEDHYVRFSLDEKCIQS